MGDDFDDFNFGGSQIASQSKDLHNQAKDVTQSATSQGHSYKIIDGEALSLKDEAQTNRNAAQKDVDKGNKLLDEATKTNMQNPIIKNSNESSDTLELPTNTSNGRNHNNNLALSHEVVPMYVMEQDIMEQAVKGTERAGNLEQDGIEKRSNADTDKGHADQKAVQAGTQEKASHIDMTVAEVTKISADDKLENIKHMLKIVEKRKDGVILVDFEHSNIEHHKAFDNGRVIQLTPEGIAGNKEIISEIRKGKLYRKNADGSETEVDKSILREFTNEEKEHLHRIFTQYRVENPHLNLSPPPSLNKSDTENKDLSTNEGTNSSKVLLTSRLAVANVHMGSSDISNSMGNQGVVTFESAHLRKLINEMIKSAQIINLYRAKYHEEVNETKDKNRIENNEDDQKYFDAKFEELVELLNSQSITQQNKDSAQLLSALKKDLIQPYDNWTIDDEKKQQVMKIVENNGGENALASLETMVVAQYENVKRGGGDEKELSFLYAICTRIHTIRKELGPA